MPTLTAEQAQIMEEHGQRMDAMRGAMEAVQSIGDLGLAMNLRRAMHGEERRDDEDKPRGRRSYASER